MHSSKQKSLMSDCLHITTDRASGALLSTEEQAKASQRVLAAIATEDRRILLSLFHEKLSLEQVCAKHRVTREQVRVLLYNARQRFQLEWGLAPDPLTR